MIEGTREENKESVSQTVCEQASKQAEKLKKSNACSIICSGEKAHASRSTTISNTDKATAAAASHCFWWP